MAPARTCQRGDLPRTWVLLASRRTLRLVERRAVAENQHDFLLNMALPVHYMNLEPYQFFTLQVRPEVLRDGPEAGGTFLNGLRHDDHLAAVVPCNVGRRRARAIVFVVCKGTGMVYD